LVSKKFLLIFCIRFYLGGLLYILSVFCSSESDPGERLQAAELLTKLQTDKLTGPRWTRFITKFLPPIFADALRDSPNTAITMFDSTNENPELIGKRFVTLLNFAMCSVLFTLNVVSNSSRAVILQRPYFHQDSWDRDYKEFILLRLYFHIKLGRGSV
ncbi:hypothetical protein OESDEN_11708, partial [Oesophagostomum dentatum]